MSELKKVFGLWGLIIYGIGDIFGAGIYALTGKVASVAGEWMWLSFAMALFIALFTACSYAELSSRFPKSGGASYYSQEAFKSDWLGFLVGWMVLFVTVVSMATLSAAFSQQFIALIANVPKEIVLVLFVILIGVISFLGIDHSSRANMISTAIESSGLLIVIAIGLMFIFGSTAAIEPPKVAEATPLDFKNIFQGIALAFYAFIGFEDLVNVSEESKNPEKDIPRAIITALLVAGSIYVLVGWIAPQVISPHELSQSPTPLLDVVRTGQPRFPMIVFSFISLFAIFNTTLLNYVTGSRLLYGMHDQGLMPKVFGKIHSQRKTPYVAILAMFPLVIGLGFIGDLKFLASGTSALLLLVFLVVNVSLIKVHKKYPKHSGFKIPFFFPYIGILGSLLAFFFIETRSMLLALGIIVIGILLYLYKAMVRKA